MAAPAIVEIQVQHASETRRWSLVTRLLFRFSFLYFSLFCVSNQIITALLPLPNVEIPDPATRWPMQQLVFWTASHVFHAKLPLVYQGSGSGDKTFDWVLIFCVLLLSVALTILWSLLDRRRRNYVWLHKWFRLFIRFALAGQMFAYGMSKAIPLQMSFPFLHQLLQPFGKLSPMGVLWSSIGASPSYEMFTGCAEILGGILLILPATTTLGALVCLADMILVFTLNMTYDVPVKLFSFHLILLATFLLAPDIPRLTDFFLRNRAVPPSTQPSLFSSRRANAITLIAQVFFGMGLIGANAYGAWTSWHQYGGGREKSALYGIWDMEEVSIDGQLRPPLLTDKERFRRAIFDFPGRVTLQLMDDSFAWFDASINSKDQTLKITAGQKPFAELKFQRPQTGHLILDGQMKGQNIQMKLHLLDHNQFELVKRGFHWIQEYPYNR